MPVRSEVVETPSWRVRRAERRRRRSQHYVKPARRSSACHDERIGRRSEGYEKCRLASDLGTVGIPPDNGKSNRA